MVSSSLTLRMRRWVKDKDNTVSLYYLWLMIYQYLPHFMGTILTRKNQENKFGIRTQ